jgi:3-dehydrosphinganine reductase
VPNTPLARHALITGGSSGIGLALAQALSGRGAAVTLVARGRERLSDAHEAVLRAHPGARVRTMACDVTDGPALAALIEAAERGAGPVDLAIASAGMAAPGRFEDMTDATARAAMEVNYFGALSLARPTLRRMRARGRGKLLMIGSAAGLAGLFGHSAYAPGKFALRGLGQALRAECAPDGVHVSVAFPPDVDTPMLAAERQLMPPELRALSALGGVMSADRAATLILRGLARGRSEILMTPQVWALARLAPMVWPVMERIADRLAAKAAAKSAAQLPVIRSDEGR